MSLLSRQRSHCEELARAARRDRAEVDAARAALAARLRRGVSSPIGLLMFFAVGLAAGQVLTSDFGRGADGAAPSRRGRRVMAAGLSLLRLLDALGAMG
ncbi:MAG TPA: hypothetical protein VFV10_17640 [Gammaproteobacteria bacterium]|nr:hypothetical protein [Gammaproteobacteria bacterium]